MNKIRKILLINILSCLIPVILFGNISIYSLVISPISIFILFYSATKESGKNNKRYYMNLLFLIILTTVTQLSPFSALSNKCLILSNFKWINILGYWLVQIGYVTSYSIYKNEVKLQRYKDFDFDDARIERDEKISAIIN